MINTSVLLVDISNTRTKFRLSRNGVICDEQRVLPTCQIAAASVNACVSGWSFSSALVSSVVPQASETLRLAFSHLPVRFVSMSDTLPVNFSGYSGKDTLGADRICNALGVVVKGYYPAVAIDMGTAVTFDVVDKKGNVPPVFLGGIISPGVALFRDYLSRRTAQLPLVDTPSEIAPEALAQHTIGAIQSGLYYGVRGMVKGILDSISSSLSCKPYVIITGGDAEWIAGLMPEIHEVDPLLTFRGMNLLLEFES